MTWPLISGLLKKMDTYPPIDFIGAAWIKKNAPKPIAEGIGQLGIRPRKGKVRKRGNISR
jgi:hypothetical protein